MNKNEIIKFCKDLGCCDACCLRYLGLKNPSAYENSKDFILKCQSTDDPQKNDDTKMIEVEDDNKNGSDPPESMNGCGDGSGMPPAKKSRTEGVCVSCLGVLQEDTWPECYEMVKEMLDKKNYECNTFACALSAPIASILRERAITLRLNDKFNHYDAKTVTPLKEAWKWSFATRLATRVGKALDSGAVSPLLVTLNIDYPDDMQELEILKTLSPSLFESRSAQKRRFTVEFTRRSVEQALAGVSLAALAGLAHTHSHAGHGHAAWSRAVPAVASGIRCVSVVCTHAPLYLGGRYIKLSRELPQSPWLVGGERVMHSSVQETIFQPIANIFQMCGEEMEYRMKFMSAGREDVDVRCLGDGRPFAIEITDPRRELTSEELSKVCEEISRGGAVVVKYLVHITRDDLVQLKKGEETKCKTYEALCIKLSHSHDDVSLAPDEPITVTERDIANINSYTNVPDTAPLSTDAAPHGSHTASPRIALSQKTPIRVLHRRPLLTRTRHILELNAKQVPGHPQLLQVRVVTEAGTYIKEWAHGEAGRTAPALGAALSARADILALDVARVHLDWPPTRKVSRSDSEPPKDDATAAAKVT